MIRDTLMVWIRTAVAVGAFVASCAGLGYLAARLVRRREWSRKVTALLCIAIAFIWPVVLVGSAMYGMAHYHCPDPNVTCDGPAMFLVSAIFAGAPILFVLSLPLAVGGAFVAGRRNVKIRGETL